MNKLNKRFGVMPALITPLDENGNLIKESLKQLIDYTIDGGVHGMFVLGSTGEFYGLDLKQKREIVELTIEYTAGRVPVYVGASDITTAECIKMVEICKDLDIAGVSVLTPYFIGVTEKELENHFLTIAESAGDLPILLYNNVGRTNIDISPALVERLSKVDNIVGIKDSSGDMTKMAEYIRLTEGENFKVFGGRDTLVYGNLAYGGAGAVAATANIVPSVVSGIYEAYMSGDLEKAKELQFKLAPLRIAFSLGSFPGIMKEAIKMVGIDTGVTLKPVEGLMSEQKEELKQILKDLGVYKSVG